MTELGRILKRISSFDEKEHRDEYLKSNGYDLDKIDTEASEIFQKNLALKKIKVARNRKEIFKKAVLLVKEKAQESGVQNITNLFKNKGEMNFAYQFSKLSEISEEDMLNMLNDEELLKVIEELEK